MAGNMTLTKNAKRQSSNHSSTNSAIATYIRDVGTMSESTAYQYFSRLNDFKEFIANEYDNRLSIDNLLVKIKNGDQDAYDLPNAYGAYSRNSDISALTLKQRVVTVKNFLEYCDIDISQSLRLRNRDKIKDDAIAQLSDQVMALTTRMQ